jgi:FtsP/CotA-like multicopper oxidase with cupredoxin domain
MSTVAVTTVAAHGGVPILQVSSERVQPGGSLDVLADMTSQGSFEVILLAPAGAEQWTLGRFDTDYEDHIRVVVVIPTDVPAGGYQIVARGDREEASAPLEVSGSPDTGETGQRLGQDEARAPVPSDAGLGPTTPSTVDESSMATETSQLVAAFMAGVLAILASLAIGLLARSRRSPRSRS